MDTITNFSNKPGSFTLPWRQPVYHNRISYVTWCVELDNPASVSAIFFDHSNECYVGYVELLHKYAGPTSGGTRVYRHIPLESMHEWLSLYQV